MSTRKVDLTFDEVATVGYDFHPIIEGEIDIFIASLLPKGVKRSLTLFCIFFSLIVIFGFGSFYCYFLS